MRDRSYDGLLNFIGYGEAPAPLWFVGAEEGLGGKMSEQEVGLNLQARCNWSPVADLHQAHLTLVEREQKIDISDPKRKGSTLPWRFMSRIALAAEGRTEFNDRDAAAKYMRERLGRAGGTTFLTELRPIPAQRSSRPGRLQDLSDDYVEEALRRRRQRQLDLLNDGKRRILICYGRSKRDEFARHFELQWERQDGFFEIAGDGRTFLLPFLGQGQMSAKKIATFVASDAFRRALRNTHG